MMIVLTVGIGHLLPRGKEDFHMKHQRRRNESQKLQKWTGSCCCVVAVEDCCNARR